MAISKEARKFISKKIKKNLEEGKPFRQSIAIAYSQARAEGYKIPQYKRLKNVS